MKSPETQRGGWRRLSDATPHCEPIRVTGKEWCPAKVGGEARVHRRWGGMRCRNSCTQSSMALRTLWAPSYLWLKNCPKSRLPAASDVWGGGEVKGQSPWLEQSRREEQKSLGVAGKLEGLFPAGTKSPQRTELSPWARQGPDHRGTLPESSGAAVPRRRRAATVRTAARRA